MQINNAVQTYREQVREWTMEAALCLVLPATACLLKGAFPFQVY